MVYRGGMEVNTYEVIMKKRDGDQLSREEIAYMVDSFTAGRIPDYQMSAFLMAVYFRGMNARETTDLTLCMAQSGDRLDLSRIRGIKVDKHSTGGVGDKTSLIIGPIMASLNVPVAKMSGRGLGHTGGTIDKLEGIPGFHTSISEEEFISQVNRVGFAIAGQTANLAPADKKLYALRDVTATVDSIPLIASSIMSKKLAAGADAIVLDVKTGSGAFMKTLEDARSLASTMVEIGKLAGKKTVAVITDMNEPLGNAVGNILEVEEAVMCLKGQGERRLMEVSKTLAAHMLMSAGRAESLEDAFRQIDASIQSGQAFAKMKEFARAQGGDAECLADFSRFPKASKRRIITGSMLLRQQAGAETWKEAYLCQCDNQEVGMTSLVLGGGRLTKDSEIDLTVGIQLSKHLGDRILPDEPVAELYGNDEERLGEAQKRFVRAYTLSEQPPELRPVVYEVIR